MAEVMAMKRPEFENKITLGNVLTVVPMLIAAVAAYYDLRVDAAAIRQKVDTDAAALRATVTAETTLLRTQQARDLARIEKLEARDDVFATSFNLYQQNTVQALTRLETQMVLLLQERRLHPIPAPLQQPQIPSRQ